LVPVMRQEARSTVVAIAAPLPIARSASFVAASRALIAIAVLRIAFGLIWAIVAALKWQAAFQLFRL